MDEITVTPKVQPSLSKGTRPIFTGGKWDEWMFWLLSVQKSAAFEQKEFKTQRIIYSDSDERH